MNSMEFNFERDIEPLNYFAGRICHDLNNLITSSMGAVSLLELKLNMTPSLDLEKEMDRVNNSIANYRTFTQRLSNIFFEISDTKISIDIGVVLRSVINELPRTINLISLEGPCKINVDATQIPLAIKEILLNAIECSSEEQPITISLKQETDEHGSWLTFCCKDEGRGIEEEDIKQVFTPFFSRGKRGNLVGLGLSQAGHILYQHGSILKVSSKKDNGTSVEFKIKAE